MDKPSRAPRQASRLCTGTSPRASLGGMLSADHRTILASTLAILVCVTPATAQPVVRLNAPASPPVADKSSYTLFNPTPDAALRTFSPDRPTKSNGPLTVDAGRFQYETDLVSYLHSNAGGVSTRTYAALDPTLKIGLTRRVDDKGTRVLKRKSGESG